MTEDLRAALDAGRAAAVAGAPVTACPYPPDSDAAVLWVRAWTAANAPAPAVAAPVP